MITCKTKKVMHWSIGVPMVERSADVEDFPKKPFRKDEATEPGISSTILDEEAEERDEDADEGGIGG